MPGSARPSEGKQTTKVPKIFQGTQRLQSLKACFMARQEIKHARICSTKRRRANHKSSKNLLRHAKAPKSQSLFYGETGSQACQDLLDQAKASRPSIVIKIPKACKGSPKSQSLFMARPEAKRARICSTKRRRAKSQALKSF